jgi:DNA-binding response OmpR family regulator
MKLLIVEDEPRIASFLMKGLRAEGYAVEHTASGREALARVHADVALVILDLGLPDLDGTEVLEQLRRNKNRVPVIVLTARGEVGDRVDSLDLGADDYVVKPFAFAELVARIRARTRPTGGDIAGSLLLHGGVVTLDLRTRRATARGTEIDLTPREFALLEMFLRHQGQALSREQLLSEVWGYHFDPGSNVVDVYVGYLRQKIGAAHVRTVRGVGYRFEPAPAR